MLPDNVDELEYVLTWSRYSKQTHFFFHNEILYEMVGEQKDYFGFRSYTRDKENIFKEGKYYSYENHKFYISDITTFLEKNNKIDIVDGEIGKELIFKKYASIARKNKIKKLLNN